MIGRWFRVPQGSHAAGTPAPAPATGTVKVLPPPPVVEDSPPPVDTVAFDAAELWTGPMPTVTRRRRVTAGGYTLPPPPEPPAAAIPPVVLLPEDQLPVPSHIYPPVTRDPGPIEYARLMRRVSALTGTSSSYDTPGAWPARQLTAPPATGGVA